LLTQKERIEVGGSARKRLSRSKLGTLERKKRGVDPLRVLLHSTRDRVPRLLPIKYSRMAASPFAFFRGSVSVMAADLAAQKHTGLLVQLCGDAHVQNLGSFEAPDGRIAFDISDFDETIPGPWEWDVKRMAASIVLAGLQIEQTAAACREAAEIFAGSYIRLITELAQEPVLVAARHQIHRLKKVQAISAALTQAERAEPKDLLKKYTETGTDKRIHFRSAAPVLWPLKGARKQEVLAGLAGYRRSLSAASLHLFSFFNPLDVAFKIVGTGSVGLRDYIVLMEGNGKGDPLFLQIKQEAPSAYAPYLKAQRVTNQGKRVADGQRSLQPISDLLLGWTQVGSYDYLVRPLNDHKGSMNLETLRGHGLPELAAIAGELLARGHARSGDALAIGSYIDGSDEVVRAIAKYGIAYADLARADFELFQKAIKQERIKVAA